MLRFAPDHHGGFFLFEDPLADLTEQIGLNALFLGMIVLLIFPISINPAEFAAPLLCMLLGLLMLLFFTGTGVFHALSAFFLPFMVYGTAAYSAAVFHNAPNSPVSMLLFLIVPFVAWLVLAVVMIIFFGGSEFFGILASIAAALVIFFCTVRFSPDTAYTPPAALFYLIRLTWVAAVLKAGGTVIYSLIRILKSKQKPDLVSPVVHVLLVAAGFLPLLAMKWLPGLLVLPLIWVLVGYLSQMSSLLFSAELIPEVIYGIRAAGGAFFANLYGMIADSAGACFAEVIRLPVNLVLMIFDTSLPAFRMPYLLAFVLVLVLEWSVIMLLPRKFLKRKA